MAVSVDAKVVEQLELIQPGADLVINLRAIKNHIAGHELRKKQYIRNGLLWRIENVLLSYQGHHMDGVEDETAWHVAEVWTECANIICVLANGGPSFVQPLLQSSQLVGLVERLSVDTNVSRRYVILKALNAVADNLPLSAPDVWTADRRLANILYTHQTGYTFAQVITNSLHDVSSYQLCTAVVSLICKTCSTERHKATMLRTGVLSALCQRLASFVVAEGLVVPSKHPRVTEPDVVAVDAAPAFAQLSPFLEAIVVLTEGFKHAATHLLADLYILSVLPAEADIVASLDAKRTPWRGSYQSGSAVANPLSQTPLDLLLPHIPHHEIQSTKDKSSFPPLGSIAPGPKRRTSSTAGSLEARTLANFDQSTTNQTDHMLILWLLYVVRTQRGRVRLVATHLLVNLQRHGLVNDARKYSFGMLLVPVLIRMLKDPTTGFNQDETLSSGMHYTSAIPSVLAQLIHDDVDKQRIAVEAKAIPKLASALKLTFEQSNEVDVQLWKPIIQAANYEQTSVPLCTLGLGGPSLSARHLMTFREGLLRALAAIAPSDDNYRTEICDQGILAQIMLALEPFQSQIKQSQQSEASLMTSGNSTTTLSAACDAIRALTRSVTALRTKLVDADVGKAIIKLMHNSDPGVRIAATKVIANLAMEFSPLRNTIHEPDLIKKLCEQAHSANATLRFESIWALKSLVLNAPNKLKREVVDELGSNWIKHLIETDPYNIPPGVVVGLSEREYPPRTLHDDTDRGTDDVMMSEDYSSEQSANETQPDGVEAPIDYNRHTVKDDLAIQEQLIDLIRNLFCGEMASEIVEYLLGEIGEDIFVGVLMDRLRPRTMASLGRHHREGWPTQKQTMIKVLYVIVHIAACAPKFRNMISTNTPLMKMVAGFCSHEEPEIREQCCWIVINLTYEDETSDRDACRRRAQEMQKLGFEGYMRRLESDPESRVRERAKTAAHLLD